MAHRVVHAVDAWQRRHRWLGFPLAVIYKFADDQGTYLTALITYYGFLSLFPLLLLLVTILGFVLQHDAGQQQQLTNLRKRALTAAEQQRLFQALPAGQHRLGAIFDVSVGPRIGERLSLVWADIDFDDNRVSIDSSRTRSDPHGRLKTAAGVRNPPFPADAAAQSDHRPCDRRDAARPRRQHRHSTRVLALHPRRPPRASPSATQSLHTYARRSARTSSATSVSKT